MKLLLFTLLSILPLASLSAQELGAFASFTEEESSTSWGFLELETFTATPATWNESGEISGSFDQDSPISFFADSITSDGVFVGDYTMAGIDTLSCDVFVEDARNFSGAEFFILTSEGDIYFSVTFSIPTSGWSTLSHSISNDQWLTFRGDTNELIPAIFTPESLRDVIEVGLNFFASSTEADGEMIAIDNFALLPDLSPPSLKITPGAGETLVSFTQITGISYDLAMSTTLQPADWTGLDRDTSDLRGEGTFELGITARPKAFFRITTWPLLIEIP